MGYAVTTVWARVVVALSPWARQAMVVGGGLYAVGLVPWALLKDMEFNICWWHAFVLLASACFFAMVYGELLGVKALAPLVIRRRNF